MATPLAYVQRTIHTLVCASSANLLRLTMRYVPKSPARFLIACLIALGPIALAGSYFFISGIPGDANLGAAFYLLIALVITPFLIFGAVVFYISGKW